MEYKIILDAGHGGEDPGATQSGRQEKDDNLKLALAVGKILQNRGVDVTYTRTNDVYQTPFQKAQIANQDEADFLISFHRNSSPMQNQYSGVETLVYDRSGKKLEMAENINKELEKVGFQNLGIKERPGLVVLRRSKMPALLVETGFINNTEDNQLYDEKFQQVAQAIADGILDTLDMEQHMKPQPTLYRVQVGLFRQKENAERLNYQLTQQGYPSYILNDDMYYKVQVGAFENFGNAILMEQRLRRDGYQTLITTR